MSYIDTFYQEPTTHTATSASTAPQRRHTVYNSLIPLQRRYSFTFANCVN